MENIETILTNCIKEIELGKATLDECLSEYPSLRQELEPLLKIALNIKKPQIPELDHNYKQAAKAQLLHQIGSYKQKKARSFTDIFSFGIPPQFAWARVAVSVLVAVMLLSSLAGGTAYAAQGSSPGDLLYPVKIGTEDARLLIAGDSAAKAELNIKFAQTRLEEMRKLVDSDEEKAVLAINGYQVNLEAARQQIRRISDTSVLSKLLVGALIDIQNQAAFCDNVIDANPEYTGLISEASTLAIDEQILLTEMLAQQDNLRAAQINLNTMQNRLQRAQDEANGKQYQMMQEALLQYQQFYQLGEEILQSAQASKQHSTEIEALTLQTLTSCLNTLDSISQQVPLEYQNTIENYRQMTLQFQSQARYGRQHQGNPGQGSQSQNSGNDSDSNIGQNGQYTSPYQSGTDTPDNGTPNSNTPSQGPGDGSGSGSGAGPSGNTGGSGVTE